MRGDLKVGKKLHLSWCHTIEEMKSKNRLQRYLAVQTKENSFKITNHQQYGYTPLLVCTYCLRQLNYKNFNHNKSNQHKIRQEFNFEEFLQTYTTHFNELPDYVGQDKGGYTTDWVNVSTMYRASKNYVCEKCGVDLSIRSGLLHVHHKNGVKQDNRFDNLQALCVLCHGDEPFHGHMSSMVEKTRADILTLRQTQNLQGN